MADAASMAAVLDEAFLHDLEALATQELRTRRHQCELVEAELSYRRRLIHGHLDLLGAELARRGMGADAGPVTDLLDSLGDDGHVAPARSPSHQWLDQDVTADAEADPEPMSADLPECTDEELQARGESLVARERVVSDQRRKVLDRLDAFQNEIVRRYRDGRASIDEVLPSSP